MAVLAVTELITLTVFCLLRGLLFGLFLGGSLAFKASLGIFAFAEIPTHLEFSIAACVVYAWAVLYHQPHGRTWLRVLLALAHLLFLVVLVATIGCRAAGPGCESADGSPTQLTIGRAYKLAVSAIAFVLGLLVFFHGGPHWWSLVQHGVGTPMLLQFGLVAAASTAALLLQAALVAYIAFFPSSLTVLTVGAVSELLRPMVLLRSEGWRSDWCFGFGQEIPDPTATDIAYTRLEGVGDDADDHEL